MTYNHQPKFEKNQYGDVIHFYGWGGECWFEYDYNTVYGGHIKVTIKSSVGKSATYYKSYDKQ